MSAGLVLRRRRCAIALAVLVVTSAAAGSLASTDADAADALARARELLAAGRLYPAELAAREAIARAPELADAHRLLGQILLRRKKPDQAVAAFERAAALAPEDPALDRDLGTARFEAGDFAGARDAFRRTLARDPDDAAVRLQLGRSELELGRPDDAAREFERAAQDPEYRQVALYNLGVAREQSGDRNAAREAFEDALELERPNTLTNRAWAHIQALEQAEAENEKPWHVGLGAGLLYDSNVGREEVDRQSGKADGAGLFELDASYQLPVKNWFVLTGGYDFEQSLYFDTSAFDLQSHTLHVDAARPIGRADASLSYLYSLNTLDGGRFLDFQELRGGAGFVATPWWYTSLSPALRVKRFDDEPERDAQQGVLGLLQLFALGNWDRHLLLGIDGELEDADDRAFDYRGFTAQTALQLPFLIRE